jgi:GR25 family glycosyltransferase involved in LPS biosynthesis
MEVALINLDHRLDRKENALKELIKLKLPVVTISGVLCDDQSNPSKYVTNQVAGCWLAHVNALEYAAISTKPILIVEDDLLVSSKIKTITKILENFESAEIDLLQIGFVTNSRKESIFRLSRDFMSYLELAFVRLCLCLPPEKIKTISRRARFQEAHLRYRVRESLGSESVSDSFLAGTHAYIVSPSFASILKGLNQPILFSSDQFLMSLSAMKTFRIYRTTKSFIKQNLKLESDISANRFIMGRKHEK